MRRWFAATTCAAAAAIGGCHVGDEGISSNRDVPTFEEFEASTYKEPWNHGVYIVSGDTPIATERQLLEFYYAVYGDGALILHTPGGADAKWTGAQALNLTYCVSDAFGARKAEVVAAMRDGAAMWEAAANVDFIYDASQDASCTQNSPGVVFDVNPTNSGGQYLARAFFPNDPRPVRNVLIDNQAFTSGVSMSGLLGHELGHSLGFRHEHIRPEAGAPDCAEDNEWRELTPYDAASIMHYPQCGNPTGPELTFSAQDGEGARVVYGAPGGGGPTDPPPTPPTPPTDPTPPGTGDPCEEQGWYGDGICDPFCPQPDPDCGGGGGGTDPADWCELLGWYGDGWCDPYCPQPDPDCGDGGGGGGGGGSTGDWCADQGWYGDGWCDWDCPQPDPDCQ